MAQKRSDIDRVDPSDYKPGNVSDDERERRNDEIGLVSTDSERYDARVSELNEAALAGDDDGPVEAEHIKGQIEETRNQMGETIDAIQDRLSFSNLSEQVTEHVSNAVETAKVVVYDATIGKAANFMKNFGGEISNTKIVRTAKNNPFPFILIGLGAGLLAYQSYAGKGNGKSRRHEFTSGGGASLAGGDRGTLSDARETVAQAAGTVTHAAENAYHKVTDAVDHAYTGAGDVVNRAYGKVGELRSTAVEQYDHYIEENPLAVGAVALALGAAVGMAIPATRYEGRLLGEYRQDLMDKAQTTASHLLDRTKEVVTEAGKTVSEQTRASMTEH
jgi:ElaB/YqjD/DUF883 family membrane-anchored ribosome-binding protein